MNTFPYFLVTYFKSKQLCKNFGVSYAMSENVALIVRNHLYFMTITVILLCVFAVFCI